MLLALGAAAVVAIPVGLHALGQATPSHRDALSIAEGPAIAASRPDDRPTPPSATTAPLSPDYLRLLRDREAEADAVLASLDGLELPLPTGTHLAFMIDDPGSFAAVRDHAAEIGAVAPDWFRVTGPGCAIEVHPEASIAFEHGDALVLPRVANLAGDTWASDATARMLADADTRACVATALADEVIARSADGINVDLEALAPEDAAPLVMFVAALRAALHPSGRRVTVDVTVGDAAYDLGRLSAVADAVVVMAYDQHHGGSAPGPIAARSWVDAQLDAALARVDPDRLVVALGGYCYDWASSDAPTRSMTMPEGFALAALVGAQPQTDPASANLRWQYRDGAIDHEVWCLDAAAGADTLALLAARGLDRTALWRAGGEDPSWWATLAADGPAARTRALESIAAGEAPIDHGAGDVIVRRLEAKPGRREIVLDDDGRVVRAAVVSPPAPTVVERLGDADGNGVVLTFDDGPDPTWTPAVLEVLAEQAAPATFFLVGTAATDAPEIVREIADAGHVVASHSWDHPDMARLGPDEAATQLERTARLLESLVDHEIRLYRAPYTAVLDTGSTEALAVQAPAFDAGYAYVGASVDPADWSGRDADAITDAILDQVEAGGRVVVLHDGGGDRSATVAALRTVIPELRRRGHPIVGLDAYLGRSRAELTPALSSVSEAVGTGTWAVTHARAGGASALQWLFAICTILAAARIVALAVLVLRRPVAVAPNPEHRPLVTVLLPAFNEGKVIEASIRSLLAGEYEDLEILVIDDGSTDDTSEVAERIAAVEPRVRCLRKANGGKASAANLGIRMAKGEIIVAVDADTVVAPDAIRRMVAHFADPRVDAVCGNVEVGNVGSILTAFQAIEYVTSQNFDRRAFAALNCIGVVPGALGAWRREAVVAAGGYSHDTLVEDADLTLCVLRRGGRITYESRAVGRTEAPLSLGALWKQRFRWTYGTYQCLAKHRGSLGKGTLGWVALPNVLLFQVLFPIVSPIGDAALVAAIATGAWSAVLSGYLGFLAMDLLASALAFRLDRKPMRWLPLLLVQRFTYRQFLYLVSFRAMLAVIAGSRHGWRKLERTGTVVALPVRAATIDRAA